MAVDREVGGIRCFEVLEHLSDYVDDDVSGELRSRIEAHLQGCDWCERFGSEFSTVVGAVRRELGGQTEVDGAGESRDSESPSSLSQRILEKLEEDAAS